MTYERRHEITTALFDALIKLGEAKSADYSPGNDTLHNFKHGAAIVGLSPFQYLMALVTKQFGAISTAISDKPEYPSTSLESLDDKIRDVIMYMVLLKCLLEDLQPLELQEFVGTVELLPEIRVSFKDGKYCQQITARTASGWFTFSNGQKFTRLIDGTEVYFSGFNYDPHSCELSFRDMQDQGTFQRWIHDLEDLKPVSSGLAETYFPWLSHSA